MLSLLKPVGVIFKKGYTFKNVIPNLKRLIYSVTHTILLFGIFFNAHGLAQSIVINEVSQGTAGSQEYVEFLVTGTALVNCNDVPPCIDLRLWIFDDNNGYLNGGATSGVGIAAGAVRFADNPFWSCIPVGTVIVIYNDGDINPDLQPNDTDMSDGNCALTIPISSNLFDRHTSLPNSTDPTYSGTGWVNGGSWTPISMANGQDGFQIYNPSNLTTPVFSIGWGGANTLGDIWMGSSTASGDVFYATDCDYYNQASWTEGSANNMQTPGAPNNALQEDCIGSMNANCNPPIVSITSTPATCGNCDGTATATITGGTAPFQLTWSPAPAAGQGATTISGLCSGVYELLLIDDNGTGCSMISTVTIGSSGDAIFPTATNPASISVQCATDVPIPNSAVVTDAADNGGPPVVTWEDDTSDGNSCPEIITRRYRVTDDCGNFIFVEQTITIDDTIPPVGTAPAAVTVQCPTNIPVADIASVTGVSDNCTAAPVVAFVSDVSDNNSCAEVITRTYSITDICGNETLVTQTITIDDDIAPLGTAPADVTVECSGDLPAEDITSVTGVSDNCTVAPIVSFVSDVSDGNTCAEVITRSYSITDECGNEILVTQTITINDTTDPTASNPADINVTDPSLIPAPDPTVVTDEADNCTTNPLVEWVSDVSDGGICPEIITRTYSVTDECGNQITVIQLIYVGDAIIPTASNPDPINVQCIGDVPAPDPAVVTDADDNGVPPVVTWEDDISDGNTCPEVITRRYRVTDDCGNFIFVVQTITVDDTQAPVFAASPANITVECIGDVPAMTNLGWTDNCDGSGTVAGTDGALVGGSCGGTITRTWTYTDVCGNPATATQLITIDDNIAPTASNPAAINVACITDVPPANPVDITDAADNCGVPTVVHVGDASDGNVCNGEEITRTYSVTDACGNSITVTQTITIDAITPTFTLSSTDPTACGETDGTITISGLTPGEDYDVSFNGGGVVPFTADGAGDIVLTGLGAGTYTGFEVSDADCPSCKTIDNSSINLIDQNPPTVDAGVNQTVCSGDQVTLTANNPDGATISWDNGVSDGTAFTPTVGTTSYTVTADLGGCISIDQVHVTVNPLPVVDAGADVFICGGEIIALTASGANSYVWDNGITNGVAFTPDQSGVYTVVGTSNNCSATDDLNVTINPISNVSFNTDDLTGCVPASFTLTNTSDIQGEECVWTLGNGVTLYGCDNVTAYFTSAGCFDVTLTVTTIDGCTSSATYGNYICVENNPVANFSADPLVVTTTDSEVNFINGSFGAVDYDWDFGDGAISNAENPSHTFDNAEEGNYTVQLIAYSSFGCSDTAYAIVQVQEDLIFYVPNTFTPDGDAYNETFLPIFTSGFDPYDYNLLIFNRWGEVLFESNNSEIGWDGTYGGKIVKDGTYVWKIEFKTKYTDERQVHHGHVNVLR